MDRSDLGRERISMIKPPLDEDGAGNTAPGSPAAPEREGAPALDANGDAGAHRVVPAPDAEAAASQIEPRETPTHPGVPLSPPGIVPESDVRTHTPAAAAPPPARFSFEEELGDLPWGYGDGRLICMVRDPGTLFVYWDLSQQQIEQAFGGLGSAQARLKLWALRGELVREVPVQLEARSWYLRDLTPGAEFRLELWAAGEGGARLMRSGRAVRLPPALPSSVLQEFYAVVPLGMRLPRDGQIPGGRPLDWKAGAAPPDWERRAAARDGSARAPVPLPWSGSSGGGTEGDGAGGKR
jgi:hypothetical protein